MCRRSSSRYFGIVFVWSFVVCLCMLIVQGGFSERSTAYAEDVGGPLSTDTTYTLAGSPYDVRLTLVVNEGVTLTIEPGVVLQFEEGVNLIVDGKLIARGTASQLVTFTSTPPATAKGSWGNINFSPTAETAQFDVNGNYLSGSIMEFCVVENGGVIGASSSSASAIFCENVTPFITNCTVKNNSWVGIEFDISSGDNANVSSISLVDNTISGSSAEGVKIYIINCTDAPDIVLNGNTISDNGDSADLYDSYHGVLIVVSSSSPEPDIVFNNNTITRNGIYGVYANGGSTVTADNNNFSNNNELGAYFRITTVSITNSIISGNYSGLYIEGESVTITNNDISKNNGWGISVRQAEAVIIRDNIVTDNGIGYYKGYDGHGGLNITLANSSGPNSATISGNIITGNINTAIYFLHTSQTSIDEVTFSGNEVSRNVTTSNSSGAITIEDTNALITGNNIYDNEGYDLINLAPEGTPNINATNNWWGTTDIFDIRDEILDFYKDSTRGIVDIEPVATGPFDIDLALPDVSVSPTSHDFGDTDVGSASPSQTFNVSNTGDADLIIDIISLTGTDAAEFTIQNDNCSGQTVIPSGTCSVDVVFLPISEGSKSTNLSIPSNDPDTHILDVSLSGTGGVSVDCNYSILPTSQTFDSSGGTGSVSVSTASDCSWTSVSNASWIMITTNDSGTGNGSIGYSVSANTSASASSRTGTMTIAGKTFTVTQEGSDDGVLSAPANFSATVDECTTSFIGTSCTVSMGWTGVSAATGYKLYYGFSSGSYVASVDLGNVTSVTFDRVPEGTYYLALTAYDSSGNESGKSDELVLTVGESSVPTNFNATVSDCTEDTFGNTTCTVSLSWTGVSGSFGYYLYYGFSSGNYAGSIVVGNVASVTYAGIAEGIYYLALTSYDSGGVESGYSDELIVEVGSNSVNRVERDTSPFIR